MSLPMILLNAILIATVNQVDNLLKSIMMSFSSNMMVSSTFYIFVHPQNRIGKHVPLSNSLLLNHGTRLYIPGGLGKPQIFLYM
jgi:hypothetical protein